MAKYVKKGNSKAGRPKIQIDQKSFENLCALQCTKNEIAGFFECSEDTIENYCNDTYGENFSAVFSKKREKGKISLRRSQWKLAEKNATMAIFLGKNYLGQKDAQDVNVDTNDYVINIMPASEVIKNEQDSD